MGRSFILGYGCPQPPCGLPGSACMARRATSTPLFGLAPDEVYRAASVAGSAVSSYLTFSPLPRRKLRRGGMFSVALSVGSPPLGVTQHPALRSSDFPHLRRMPDSAITRPTPNSIRTPRPRRGWRRSFRSTRSGHCCDGRCFSAALAAAGSRRRRMPCAPGRPADPWPCGCSRRF